MINCDATFHSKVLGCVQSSGGGVSTMHVSRFVSFGEELKMMTSEASLYHQTDSGSGFDSNESNCGCLMESCNQTQHLPVHVCFFLALLQSSTLD